MMNQNKLNEARVLFPKIQALCFLVIALNLLWPLFSDTWLTHFFSVACIALFAAMFLNIFINLNVNFKSGSMICYVSLLFFSACMIFAYGFIYPIHSTATFLGLSMDSYAIFFVTLLLSVFPAMLYVGISDVTIGRLAKIIILAVLVVSAFYTSVAVAVNPDALRARVMMEHEGLEELLFGTPGYAETYSYALLLPIFVHKSKMTHGKTRLYYVICSLIIAYILVVAQFATALLIAVVSVVLYLILASDKKRRPYVILVALLIGLFLIVTDGGTKIFHALSEIADGSWSVKLKDMALTLSGQNDSGNVSGRTELYRESFDAFLESPLLGKYWKDTGSIGGHAFAIDILGMTGLLGFALFGGSVYGNFMRMKNHPSYQESKPAVIACMVGFLMLVFLKNIVTSLAIFFTFFALIPYLLKSKERVSDESDQADGV